MEGLELRLAKALNGPWEVSHIDMDKLLELRDVKWKMLNTQDQAVNKYIARKLIKEFDIQEK